MNTDQKLFRKQIHRLFDEVWNQKKIKSCEEIFSSNVKIYQGDSQCSGSSTFQSILEHWQSAFPDLHHTIEDEVYCGDKAVIRWKGEGTHLGVFLGLFPTKRKMRYSGITIFKEHQGKISECWVSADLHSLWESLTIYSDKKYQEDDFSEDFQGPAKLIYTWFMKARRVPSCRQKIDNALRDQFAFGPVDGQPALTIPPDLLNRISVQEKWIPIQDRKIRVLIYSPHPSEPKPLPVLLYFHGGGWSIGNPESSDLITRKLAHQSGFVVASVDYSLAPENPFPQALDDCMAVYQWIREKGKDVLHVNSHKIAVGGDSCGGNLALALVLKARDEGYQIPDSVLALCPLTDFIIENHASFMRLGPRSLIYDYAFLSYVRSIYSAYPEWKNPYVSPLYGDLSHFCPTFVLSAGQDPLIDDNKAFVKKLKESGGSVEHFIHEEMPHAYYYFLGLSKEEEEAYQQMTRFLKKTFSS